MFVEEKWGLLLGPLSIPIHRRWGFSHGFQKSTVTSGTLT